MDITFASAWEGGYALATPYSSISVGIQTVTSPPTWDWDLTSCDQRGTGKCGASQACRRLSPWCALPGSWGAKRLHKKAPQRRPQQSSSSWPSNRASRWHQPFKWHPCSSRALNQAPRWGQLPQCPSWQHAEWRATLPTAGHCTAGGQTGPRVPGLHSLTGPLVTVPSHDGSQQWQQQQRQG